MSDILISSVMTRDYEHCFEASLAMKFCHFRYLCIDPIMIRMMIWFRCWISVVDRKRQVKCPPQTTCCRDVSGTIHWILSNVYTSHIWADEAPLLQPNHLSLSEELDKLLLRWQQECWLEQSSASATATNHFFITYELWPGHLKCISELWAIRYECANSGCYWRLLLETLREATGKVSPLGLKVLRFWVWRDASRISKERLMTTGFECELFI